MPIVDSNNTTDQDNTIIVLRDETSGLDAQIVQDNGERKLIVKSTSVPQPIGNLFFQHAENGGSEMMNVNGSGTPVDFTITADATRDIFVESLAFEALDGGIKMNTFLGLNSSLTNGLEISVKSEDTTFSFLLIKSTLEFDSHFAFGPGRSYEIVFASGNDSLVSRFGPSNGFLIKKQGTYGTDDFIQVRVQDNLSSVSDLKFLAFGAYDI